MKSTHTLHYLIIPVLITVSALAITSVPAITAQDERPFQILDLRTRDQAGQFTFYDAPEQSALIGQPIASGDLDGNGCGDVAVAGINDSFARPDSFRSQAGHVRVVMNICEIAGQVDLNTLDASQWQVLTILGARRGDILGSGIHIADMNGDGLDDLLIGSPNHDGTQGGRPNAGAAYWLAGRPGFAERETIDLLTPPDDMLVIYGAQESARLGMWVHSGDIDGDGFRDLLLGANEADGINGGRLNAGEVWVIYGAADMLATYSALLDLAFGPPTATRIIGPDADDLFGSTVHGADLNADGFDDVIAAAGLWRGSAEVEGLSFGGGDGPANERFNAGDTFVLFGDDDLHGETIDLAGHIDSSGSPVNSRLTVIYGADENDLLGEEIYAGDFNGDGRNELVLGTLIGNGRNNQFEGAGEAWVIATHEPFVGQAFDLASPLMDRAVVIHVDQPFTKAGDTVELIDIDQDGYDDLLYAAPTYDASGLDGTFRPDAGLLVIIYGSDTPNGLPPHRLGELLIADPPEEARVQYIAGADDGDMMAYHMTAYDVDGDGFPDLIPNGMGGDGPDNQRTDAGEFYVISGAMLKTLGR